MTCPCSSRSAEEAYERSWYSLGDTASKVAPATLAELDKLLCQWSSNRGCQWWGKMYVASTIWHDEREAAFLQKGCSPNYRGGLWTLACCKHDMRAAASFKEQVKSGQSALAILTLGRASGPEGCQYLVSAAKVTAWFDTMDDYAEYLLRFGNKALVNEKMSIQRRATGLGCRYGDCHADRRGRVGDPYAPHVHAGNAARDLDGTHLLLASDCFVVWRRPTLRARSTLHQSRYGINVTRENLESLLVAV